MSESGAAPEDAFPSDGARYERARSLLSEACYSVALQRRRLRSIEPEDGVFIFRWWADLQFLIVALRRGRRAAEIAATIPSIKVAASAAIAAFDESLPHLKTMRDVGEHVEQYALDSPRRHYRSISRRDLQVGLWDGAVFQWLGGELDVDEALFAVGRLQAAIIKLAGSVSA